MIRYFIFFIPAVASAHMVSMSTGELKVEGNRAKYELRMPTYEAAHTADPERTLLEHIVFRSGGAEGRMIEKKCGAEQDNYVCTATYEFPSPVETLEAECTLASITVPNHIHVLRAYRGDKTDQAVFDVSYTSAEIRFRPPTRFETFVRESGAGFMRAIGGVAPLLFLMGLVLAARSIREMLTLAGAFIVGEIAACAAAPHVWFTLSPRFIEAAAALTIAYLAFEIVLLPQSGQRWLVVGILGLFHGAYFSIFLSSSGYRMPNFLTGVVIAELIALSILFLLLSKALNVIHVPRAVPALATVLMTVGVVWFVVRVWS
jgi:hypothetical protein